MKELTLIKPQVFVPSRREKKGSLMTTLPCKSTGNFGTCPNCKTESEIVNIFVSDPLPDPFTGDLVSPFRVDVCEICKYPMGDGVIIDLEKAEANNNKGGD